MVRREIVIAAALLLASCRPGDPTSGIEAPIERIEGRIVTILSQIPEENRTLTYEVYEAGGLVRSTDELDRWRLLDVPNRRVTFVDEVAKTRRVMTLEQLRERKERLAQGPVPDWYPHATFARTGESKEIAGVTADQYVIQAGGFRREMWVSREPLLGDSYMALRFGSEDPGGPAPAALAKIQLELMKLEGFPLEDQLSLPMGEDVWGVQRRTQSIARGEIVRTMFEIPEEYGARDDVPAIEAPSFPIPQTPR